MQKHIASSLTAIGFAAVLVLPSAYAAQARDRGDRGERTEMSTSQSIDRADARIAILKADLRLTADQAKNWSGFETALREVATKRAKILAASATRKAAAPPVTRRRPTRRPQARTPTSPPDGSVTRAPIRRRTTLRRCSARPTLSRRSQPP